MIIARPANGSTAVGEIVFAPALDVGETPETSNRDCSVTVLPVGRVGVAAISVGTAG